MIGTDAQTFLDRTPHLILGILWQLVKFKRKDELKRKIVDHETKLAEQLNVGDSDGDYSDLGDLNDDSLLFRWFNTHLKKAGQKEVSNLGKDLRDSRAFMYVLNQLDPVQCPLDALEETDDLARAEAMFINALAFGAADVVGPSDILRGNSQVNLVLVSELFDTWHRRSFGTRPSAPPKVVNLDGAEESKGPANGEE